MSVIRFLVALECIGFVLFYSLLWIRIWVSNGDFRLTFSGPGGSLGWVESYIEPVILVGLLVFPLIIGLDEWRKWLEKRR